VSASEPAPVVSCLDATEQTTTQLEMSQIKRKGELAKQVKPESSQPKQAEEGMKASKRVATTETKEGKQKAEAVPITRDYIRELELQLINHGTKNLNNLVHIISAAAPQEFASHEPVDYLAMTQSARRCFLYLAKAGHFTSFVRPASVTEGSSAAKVQSWLGNQAKKFVTYLCHVLADAETMEVPNALQIAIIDTLVELSVVWAHSNPDALLLFNENGTYLSTMLALFADPNRDRVVLTHASETWFNRYDDLRAYTFRILRQMIPARGGSASFASLIESNPFAISRAALAAEGKCQPLNLADIFETCMRLLGTIKPPLAALNETIIGKQMVAALATDRTKSTMKIDLSTQKRDLSDLWLAILSNVRLSLSGYKTALLLMENIIIPSVSTPIALYDFLTDSYSKGGVISVLALAGVFRLMTKHGLENPNFFKQLYNTIEPVALQSKYRARFLTLLSQALMGSYMPSYLVASFCKRLCRVALFTTPSITIYILALIFNLVRRHPILMNLVNRNADGHVVPILNSLAAFRKLREHALAEAKGEDADDEDGDDSDEEDAKVLEHIAAKAGTTVAVEDDQEASQTKTFSLFSSLPKADAKSGLQGTIFGSSGNSKPTGGLLVSTDTTPVLSNPGAWDQGLDPFVEHSDAPANSCALDSSFLEIAALMNHYSPDVSRLAKLIFSDTAQKQMLYLPDYSSKTYSQLFQEAISYRKNRITPMAYEKPTGMLTAATSAAAASDPTAQSPAAQMQTPKFNVMTSSFFI